MPSMEDFRRVWRNLADEGQCDAIYSSEYRRIVREWYEAGRPAGLRSFIAVRASSPPPPPASSSPA
jgi:hypothetical protein